ncbi:MAG: tyrosine--tRNA ligase [Pseudomonadota bacterium]|nr:tyrosine--tRNA ligase [Pseudomonadota bacterium]QKK05910.1 MAG: tyrosine--tRNA ligase [Pseudomonadota bacterium]
MTDYKSDFMQIMAQRGFLHQCSDAETLDKKLSKGTMTAYVGFDATATSLHIGNLLGIMMLRWFQKCGHKPITLMGGGTSKVGDPSGKDESRNLLDDAAIQKNIDGIKTVFDRFLDYENGENAAVMVNNDDWLSGLKYIEFLRDYGRHFSVNRMLTMESVKLRLEREQSLSFLEFNYMILQGYDFLELNRKYGCELQMGGSDQWGNIINGVELTRRAAAKEVFALTCPLLLDAAGKKMGKTASGEAVWLNADKMAPYDYYQYWRNADDADIGKLLRLFTELPLDEIAKLEALKGAEINEAKKVLAFEATKLCHCETTAKLAEETARKTFEEGQAGGALPSVDIARAELEKGIPLFVLLGNQDLKLAASNGEARRLIKGGGARINDQQITDENYTVTADDLAANGTIKLSAGKKKHALVRAA